MHNDLPASVMHEGFLLLALTAGPFIGALLLVGSMVGSLAADTSRTVIGQVVTVVDGDTIQVRIGDRTER